MSPAWTGALRLADLRPHVDTVARPFPQAGRPSTGLWVDGRPSGPPVRAGRAVPEADRVQARRRGAGGRRPSPYG